MATILETKHLTHVYSEKTPFERVALQDVNFTVDSGEYLAIIGHTGSGKSTLLQHLNGLLKPTSGQVLLDGTDIWQSPAITRKARFDVGLVFQYPEYQLFEETVYRDIAFGPRNMGLSEAEIDLRVKSAAQFVELAPDLLEKSPFELSGGQKRRVAIAGVIAMEPKVLILDEPTAGLDPSASQAVMENIAAYQAARGAAIVLVSHSMEQVAKIATRVVVMQGGQAVQTGSVADVFADEAALAQMGLSLPQMTRVFRRLKQMGIPVSDSVYTVQQARDAILAAKGGR